MSMPPPPPPGDQPPSFPSQPFPTQQTPSQPFPSQQYGAAPPGYAPYGQGPGAVQAPRHSGMAIAGFVLGIVGLIPCFWLIFQVPGVLGLIFSFVGLKATKSGLRKGRGLAIAGLVMSILGVLAAASLTAFVLTSDDCVRTDTSFECDFD